MPMRYICIWAWAYGLYADQVGERLGQEIAEKGIVAFDREGCHV